MIRLIFRKRLGFFENTVKNSEGNFLGESYIQILIFQYIDQWTGVCWTQCVVQYIYIVCKEYLPTLAQELLITRVALSVRANIIIFSYMNCAGKRQIPDGPFKTVLVARYDPEVIRVVAHRRRSRFNSQPMFRLFWDHTRKTNYQLGREQSRNIII